MILKDTRSSAKNKPQKPHADYPLFAHAAGVWAKKIRGLSALSLAAGGFTPGYSSYAATRQSAAASISEGVNAKNRESRPLIVLPSESLVTEFIRKVFNEGKLSVLCPF